jgi:hypothetical protein
MERSNRACVCRQGRISPFVHIALACGSKCIIRSESRPIMSAEIMESTGKESPMHLAAFSSLHRSEISFLPKKSSLSPALSICTRALVFIYIYMCVCVCVCVCVCTDGKSSAVGSVDKSIRIRQERILY